MNRVKAAGSPLIRAAPEPIACSIVVCPSWIESSVYLEMLSVACGLAIASPWFITPFSTRTP